VRHTKKEIQGRFISPGSNEFQISVPSLKDRPEDIGMYADFFLRGSNEVWVKTFRALMTK